MFEKLKQIKDMRDQAKQIQSVLSQETVTVEKNGIELTLNGNQEILNLKLNPEVDHERTAKILIDLFNDAIKDIQKKVAQKMRDGSIQMPNIF
jgi:DNA-binding protein YbaB